MKRATSSRSADYSWALRVRYHEEDPWVYIGPFDTHKEATDYKKRIEPNGYVVHIVHMRPPVH